MATSDCFASVVAPLYNDADIVEAFVRDVIEVLKRTYENYELVLVDDGSTDDTAARVTALLDRERCIRLVRLSRRFGRDVAISAGLDTVIGDFVVVLVPESDPPELIPEFIERCRRGAGIVYGIRARRPAEPFYLSVGARLFYWYFNHIIGVDLPRNSTDYRAYSRQSVNAITRIKDRLRYLRTFGAYVGFGGQPLVYEPRPRRARVRGRTPGEALALAINMTVANSTQPLRLVSLAGLALSALSGLHVLYVLAARLFSAHVAEGWTTQQLYVSVMFMFLFVILAVLCEYVGRLLGEVVERPLYFVLEERTSSVLLVDEQRKNVVTRSD
uniref:Glycosyltransferase n=1 Tax=Eiseniibacteriota bacterium TaxID=2212470 RepID=A0A832I6P9_UNCEI